MKKIDHIDLFNRFIRGETNEQEDRIISEWFGKEESQKELFSECEKLWASSSNEMPRDHQDQLFKSIRQRIDPDKYSYKRALVSRPLFKYAVVASLFLLFTVGIFNYTENRLSGKEFIVYAEEGQKATVELPDGTVVCLNSGSKLKYNGSYQVKQRKVILEGEGWFDIKKNQKTDFVVQAGDLEIKALGTVFNVKAYLNDSLITTTLIEGKISVGNNLQAMLLSPNEQIKYSRISESFSDIQTCDASRYALWKNDELFFDCETLEQVSETLKRLYSMDVVFTADHVKEYTFCGVINNRTMYNVLHYLSLTAPVTYEVKDNKIYFMERTR